MIQNYLEQVQAIIADKKIHVWEKQQAFNDLNLTTSAGNAKAGARAAIARCGISKNYKYSAELKKIGCL